MSGRQHCDTTTKVDHAVPHCKSDEVFRGVMMDSARGVFQGKISVWPQAQKTDARMMTKALLLSDRAEMDSKPELEIYADDVKCAHGATVGTLDDEALFYLMSRGIDPETARTLLISAFIEEPLDLIEDEMIRDAFDRAIEQALSRRAAS